jgi:hypothetical protein
MENETSAVESDFEEQGEIDRATQFTSCLDLYTRDHVRSDPIQFYTDDA